MTEENDFLTPENVQKFVQFIKTNMVHVFII
jgi:hypothetical protein